MTTGKNWQEHGPVMEYVPCARMRIRQRIRLRWCGDLFTSQPTMHGMTGQAMSARRVMQIIWNLDFGPIDVFTGNIKIICSLWESKYRLLPAIWSRVPRMSMDILTVISWRIIRILITRSCRSMEGHLWRGGPRRVYQWIRSRYKNILDRWQQRFYHWDLCPVSKGNHLWLRNGMIMDYIRSGRLLLCRWSPTLVWMIGMVWSSIIIIHRTRTTNRMMRSMMSLIAIMTRQLCASGGSWQMCFWRDW